MKLETIIFLILVVHLIAINSQRISIIGSQFIPEDSNYKVLLLTNNLDEESFVNISLICDGQEKIQHFSGLRDSSFKEVKFKVSTKPANNYELKAISSENDKCMQQSIKLIKTHENPKIFVQLDKPIYKSKDDIKFRIFVLNKLLIPVTSHGQLDVAIYDSNNNLVQNFDNIKTKAGVFEGLVKIAFAPNFGRWKIVTNSMGREIVKYFNVEKSVDEDLEVQLEIPSIVSFKDKRIYINVVVSDKLNKFFIGSASISASAKFKGSNKIEINHHVMNVDLFGNKKVIPIDFSDDLGIRFPTADMLLKFDVTVTDAATKRSLKVSKEIEMKYKIRNVIQVSRRKYFKPGFKLPTKVRVKLLDGRIDNSFNQLSITNEYHNRNKKTKNIEKLIKTFKLSLRNGEVSNILQIKPETEAVVVKLEFAGTELIETIKPLETYGANEYMQIAFANRSTKVGDTVMLSATTTGEFETLHVLIIGQDGIIHSQEFSDAIGIDVFKFPIKLTNEMKPEARLLAFYVKPESGVIIYDELQINLGFSIDNSIDIYADEISSPNKQATIRFKTEKGSKVYLSAADINPLLLSRDNEISRNDIYNEMVYYINLKYPNSSDYHFEKLNAFILNPLISKSSCEDESAKALSYDSNVNDEFLHDNNDIKYFPDVWFDESYVTINEQEQSISHKVPEALTTFRFFGISVHPQKGFTVAKVQPKTRVKREILIQLKAPPSVYNEEILWLDVAVFNTLLESLNADVTVTITNGVLVDYHRRIEYNIKCLDFQQASIRSFNFSTNMEAEKLSRIETLLIQPDGNGDITVAVDAFAGSYNDEVTKVIKVRNIPTSSNINEESISEAVKVESNSNLSIQDILSSSVKTLESFFSNSLTSDEERLLRFSSAITSHKYLQLNSKGSTNKLVTGYQEALSILDKIFQSKDQNSIILTAIAVETLIESRQFINVDQTLITKAFDYLKTYQQDDGSFIYDSNIDYREEMGENRKDIQTAHIVSIFLKNEDKKDFMDVITKALNYLKQINIADDDYQKVITAYALALNKDLKSAENLLKAMKNMHLALQKHKLNAVDIEVVSYKILTKILLDEDPQEDTNWLFKQIRSFNEYYSPYNAELTLRALFEFAKYKHIQPDESSKNVKIFELERHHLKPANTSENFIIKANRVEISREELRIEISLQVKDQDIKNLIGFEMELPRGFRYIKQDSSENLLNFNIDNNGNIVQFQLNKLKVGKIAKISINALKVFEFSTHQYSMIKVYDYYRSNIKDTFYYVFDKNEESCERIRVEREIEKAKNVLDNAKSAQNILSEAQTINTEAKQYINKAQIIADNAKQNLVLSNTKLFEAQEKLSNALNITQNSIEILTNSENAGKPAKSEISIVQIHSIDSPQRLKRNVILLESEAIRTQKIAEDARNQANEANEQALKAEKALNVSILSFDKATKDVESAKRDVKHALAEIKATISEAKVLIENVESAKNEVSALKNNLLNETEKKFYQLDNHIKSVKIDVENNVQNISQTQKNVKAALSTANSILVRARKALKGSDVQEDIDKEAANVGNILEAVRNILSGTRATKKIATEAFESINFTKKRTNEVKEKCERLNQNADSIMQKANEVYEKSNEKGNLYIKKLESEVKKSEIANNAQISMNKAQSEFETASKKYEDDNFAAISAKDEADKARAEEVKRAESNANISSNQVAIIEGVVSKISNLSTEVADIEAKAKNIRNKANDHFKFLENRHHLFKKSEILKSYRENEEEKKLLTSTRIHLVQNLTKEAQEVLEKAHLFASEISQSVNNAIKSSDSVKTTFESNKIANLLGELKLLTSKVSAIESSLIEIVASCKEAKMLAEITHEVSQEVMKIFNDFSEANKNFNNANQNKKKLLSSVNSLNDNMENSKLQHLTSNLENLYREFPERLLLNSEKSNMQQVLKNAFNTALNVANSKDYVDSLRKKDEFPNFRNITHNSNIELQKMITHIKLADQILHQIIEVRNYADSVAKAEHDINNTQILIDEAVQNILPSLIQIDSNLKAQDINEKSLMNSFTSLFKNLMSTIKAAENDKSLANFASEEEKKFYESVQRVFNAAENIVKEKILEDAIQSAIQVEASLNDTIKHKNEILKIKEISLLSLEAAKAVAKASNALVKSFNETLQAIQEEKNTTESQALADEIFKSLQNKTDAKLIFDNITSLMITLETASAQIQQAAVNVLNNLIDAENQRKSIEGLVFENQDIENIKTYVNLANEAAEKAEQESKLAEKSFEETKAVAFQIHENLKLIENIAENEKNANELNNNRIESRNKDKHEEQNKSEKNADNLEENGEELKQQMINEDAKIESATTSSSQAVDEHEINENDLSKTVEETDEQKTDNNDTKGNHDEVTQQSITENGEKSTPIQEAQSVSKIDEGMS